MTRVLVTGGHGLIGSRLVRALLDRGDTVTVLARGDRPASALAVEGTAAAVELVHGDVGDGDLLRRTLADRHVELVFHLAAQSLVHGDGDRDGDGPSTAQTFETNVAGTWTLLDACLAASRPRVVVASSEKVYGPAPPGRTTETSPFAPADAYAASKAAADVIARSYWPTHGLPVAVARLANVYGGGDLNPSRLVPEAVWAALAGRRPVIRSNGVARRDFLHVADAVAAYLAIADLLGGPTASSTAAGAAFNVGSGARPTVLEIVAGVFAAADVPLDLEHPPAAPADAAGNVDHTLLRELTGWRPHVDLEDGLRRTVAWYRRHAPSPPTDETRPTT